MFSEIRATSKSVGKIMAYKTSCNFNKYYSMCIYVLVAQGEGTEKNHFF